MTIKEREQLALSLHREGKTLAEIAGILYEQKAIPNKNSAGVARARQIIAKAKAYERIQEKTKEDPEYPRKRAEAMSKAYAEYFESKR